MNRILFFINSYSKKRYRVIFLFFLCLLVVSAYAQDELWQKLTDDSVMLYQRRKYKEAIQVAREALAIAQKTFGPEHPNVAESLDNLATYLAAGGNYEEAEVLYRQSLAIIEKNFGESEYLAIFLNYIADFFTKIGKADEADKLRKRASEIRAKK